MLFAHIYVQQAHILSASKDLNLNLNVFKI